MKDPQGVNPMIRVKIDFYFLLGGGLYLCASGEGGKELPDDKNILM